MHSRAGRHHGSALQLAEDDRVIPGTWNAAVKAVSRRPNDLGAEDALPFSNERQQRRALLER